MKKITLITDSYTVFRYSELKHLSKLAYNEYSDNKSSSVGSQPTNGDEGENAQKMTGLETSNAQAKQILAHTEKINQQLEKILAVGCKCAVSGIAKRLQIKLALRNAVFKSAPLK